jgi:hypothetical protein
MYFINSLLIFYFNLFIHYSNDSFLRELKLVFEENFENGSGWEGYSYAFKQVSEDHSFSVINDTVFYSKILSKI